MDSSLFTGKDLCLNEAIPFSFVIFLFFWLFMMVSMSDYTGRLSCVLHWRVATLLEWYILLFRVCLTLSPLTRTLLPAFYTDCPASDIDPSPLWQKFSAYYLSLLNHLVHSP